MLTDIALFLAAAVLFVPLFRRAGLGAVLGYLAGGIALGPWGFKLITDVESILHASEFGVVLLLFVIGLELQPSRLWTLRRAVFGLGGAQVLLSTLVLAAAGWGMGLGGAAALVAGFGLAMSSTAFVLQLLAERNELTTRHGRASFAILLFQDLSVIPFLALIPLLAVGEAATTGGSWFTAAKIIAVFAAVILSSRYLLRPAFRMIAAAKIPEVFTAATLLIVIATALAMERVGLSMSLGAFLAGVLLADSEYRHELQADIEPFKGLLLGLFFIAVGMSANLGLLYDRPLQVLALTLGLLLVKGLILWGLGLAARLPADAARALAVTTSQGGEFAFVLFALAVSLGVLSASLQGLLIMVVTLSMLMTPLLVTLSARWNNKTAERPYDEIEPTPDHQVILCGFGPFGQIIGRLLRVKRIPFTVLDKDSEQVDFVRQFGNKIFYGDASRLDLLRAARADQARLLVLAIPDIEPSLAVARMVRQHFPQLRIFAMAVNRQHALRLMDLGIEDIVRRSFYSSLEMSRLLLLTLGDKPEAVERALKMFRQKDEESLRKQHAVAHDEKAVIQTAKEAGRELELLFEADRVADSLQETKT